MTDRHSLGFNQERHKGYRVGTLWCSNSDVDGEITFAQNFDEMSFMARIDLLNDFIGLLERELEEQHNLWERANER
jgi:hypothetical protein